MQKCNKSIYVTFILCIHQRISTCNFVTKIIFIVGSPQLIIIVVTVSGAGCSTTGYNNNMMPIRTTIPTTEETAPAMVQPIESVF